VGYLLVLACCWILAFATPSTGASADGPRIRYDPATVVDVFGIVRDIREVTAPPEVRGIHLVIQSEQGDEVDAYLGPKQFVGEFVSSFGKGSKVQVIGSKVKSGNAVILLAREVRKGDTTLYLRDKRGNPYWDEET
jgi:hypothetical protein